MVRLFLVDADEVVACALREAFRPFPGVEVLHGDILSVAHNTVVSPANSDGFMDGGIDAAYRHFFGPTIESIVREAIGRRQEGHLPVGASLVVRTGHAGIPFLIVAPTMLGPEAVSSANCYRAMRAVLRMASEHEEVGQAVFCPGLCTGVGMVPADQAAREMAEAYRDWHLNEGLRNKPCRQDTSPSSLPNSG